MSELTENRTLTGRRHPGTSHAAAGKVLGKTGTSRRRLMAAIAILARTDEELQRDLAMPANTQRPRRVELVDLGFVRATTLRRATDTGSPSIVWEATDDGRAALVAAARVEVR